MCKMERVIRTIPIPMDVLRDDMTKTARRTPATQSELGRWATQYDVKKPMFSWFSRKLNWPYFIEHNLLYLEAKAHLWFFLKKKKKVNVSDYVLFPPSHKKTWCLLMDFLLLSLDMAVSEVCVSWVPTLRQWDSRVRMMSTQRDTSTHLENWNSDWGMLKGCWVDSQSRQKWFIIQTGPGLKGVSWKFDSWAGIWFGKREVLSKPSCNGEGGVALWREQF